MIFDILARSIENPSTSLSDPAQWLIDAWGGGSTKAGQSVTTETALKYTAVWGCVRIISESLAVLPLNLYRVDGKKREIARDHIAHQLVHDSPNDEMTSFVFREMMQAHLLTSGNAYAPIVRDSANRPRKLLPISPSEIEPVRKRGRLAYKIKGRDRLRDAANVLHIPGLGFDGIKGFSPIAMHREAIGLGLAAQEFGATFFGNGATLSGVLEVPGDLGDNGATRLRDQWNKAHSGTGNAHKTAVLEFGTKYQSIGVPPEDAQFLETRKFQITDIARIYRVPPHMLADLERATFSNITEQDLAFVKHTMIPWLVRWEQELNRKLLSQEERETMFFKFNVAGLLRGDIKSRYESYQIGRQQGFLSVNDIRELEDMNPINGGDVYLEPLNMVPAGSQDRSEDRSKEAEIARKEATALRKNMAKYEGKPADFMKWAETFFRDHVSHVAKKLGTDPMTAAKYCESGLEAIKQIKREDFYSMNLSVFDGWEETRSEELKQVNHDGN